MICGWQSLSHAQGHEQLLCQLLLSERYGATGHHDTLPPLHVTFSHLQTSKILIKASNRINHETTKGENQGLTNSKQIREIIFVWNCDSVCCYSRLLKEVANLNQNSINTFCLESIILVTVGSWVTLESHTVKVHIWCLSNYCWFSGRKNKGFYLRVTTMFKFTWGFPIEAII